MKRKLTMNKLETIHELKHESSDNDIFSHIENRTVSKSILNFITRAEQFICLTEKQYYDISCTLEYLEFCESKLSVKVTSLNKRAQNCLRQLNSQRSSQKTSTQ
ncbi:Hypothetical_protein [Hexamita inflata]|uniref:Hypothetical_protein n=1 Tax=Hexamita inflata TaxID=28002 RepID=A0ABP1H6F3_9EUKA